MPLDSNEPRPLLTRPLAWRQRLLHALSRLRPSPSGDTGPRMLGLSARLLGLTAMFVMLAEVLIFVPSIANYRVSWLTDRLTSARLASLAADAAPGGIVPAALGSELLMTAQVRSVAIKSDNMRRLVLPPETALTVDRGYDLRAPSGVLAAISYRLDLIWDALSVFVHPPGRTILVVGHPLMAPAESVAAGDFIEIVLSEGPLRNAMIGYALNILGLSIVISVIAAALVYLSLTALLVKPMMRLTRSMLRFSENPEDSSRIIVPSNRTDEIGTAERELAQMQSELHHLLHQKNRLAQLGLGVAKINHDLRNILATAHLVSDRLSALPDPAVQRFSPKLLGSLDRAIRFCNDILRYGRAEETAPRRTRLPFVQSVVEVADGLGLPREDLAFRLDAPDDLVIDADPDHLHRVFNNLLRNAVQALETSSVRPGEIVVTGWRSGAKTLCEIRDNGPGIPPTARDALFKAFSATTSKTGTGLGLAISADLVTAHGGFLTLVDSDVGAVFRLEIPDRQI